MLNEKRKETEVTGIKNTIARDLIKAGQNSSSYIVRFSVTDANQEVLSLNPKYYYMNTWGLYAYQFSTIKPLLKLEVDKETKRQYVNFDYSRLPFLGDTGDRYVNLLKLKDTSRIITDKVMGGFSWIPTEKDLKELPSDTPSLRIYGLLKIFFDDVKINEGVIKKLLDLFKNKTERYEIYKTLDLVLLWYPDKLGTIPYHLLKKYGGNKTKKIS